MAYKIHGKTSFVLHKANAKDLFRIFYEEHEAQLPRLLPEVYKKITRNSIIPPHYVVEYAEGFPMKTETYMNTLKDVEEKGVWKISYKVIAGDVLDHYKSFNYTISFTHLIPRGTSVEISYECDKENADVGPAFLESYASIFMKFDQKINN